MIHRYTLKNLDCAACAIKLERHLRGIPGVRSANVNFSTQTLVIDTNDITGILQEISRIEPDVTIIKTAAPGIADTAGLSGIPVFRELTVIALSIVLTIIGMFMHQYFHKTAWHSFEYITIGCAYLLCGYPILKKAWATLLRGRMFDENMLMAIATLCALVLHQFPEAAGVVIFFRTGDLLQRITLGKSRKSIRALMALRPEFAVITDGTSERRVAPEQVSVGMHILVAAGERFPLDGIISAGTAHIDTSAITGEHIPRLAAPGDTVHAGYINLSGILTVEVTKEYAQSSLAKIMELTETAINRKAKTEKFITRFAQYYTPAIVAAAVLVAVMPPLLFAGQTFADWIHRALVLMVISCPCALVISIPLGYFGGIGAASKRGILIKGSNVFDDLTQLKTVVFDKTGTLTNGVFNVTGIVPCNGFSKQDVLRYSARAQAHSHHPAAVSIVHYYGKMPPVAAYDDYTELSGFGIIAHVDNHTIITGNDRLMHQERIEHPLCTFSTSVVHVAVDGTYAGYITIGDELKPDVPEALAYLRHHGIHNLYMVTGDNNAAAHAMGDKLNLTGIHADLLPHEKMDIVEKLLEEIHPHGKLAFVGDGINDAPVIARADVGIAMGDSGTDAAIDTSDVVIMSGSPKKVAEAVELAKRTRIIIWQNIIFAFGVKAFFITLGIMGVATMWEAVFADMGVAVAAIVNATRISK